MQDVIRTLVEQHGVAHSARLLGLTRHGITAYLSGLCRPATRLYVETRVASYLGRTALRAT